jgi:hypothetical protein
MKAFPRRVVLVVRHVAVLIPLSDPSAQFPGEQRPGPSTYLCR